MPETRETLKLESVGALTVGAGKDRWQAPFNGQVLGAGAVVGTAPTGASVIVDVLNGGNSVFGANPKPTIAATATSSATVAETDLGATSRFVKGDVLSLSVTQIGSGTAGSDLDVSVQFVAT